MISYSQFEDDSRIDRYARALIKRGHQVDMLGLGAQGQPYKEKVAGVRLFRLQSRDFGETTPFSYLWRLVCFFIRTSCVLIPKYLKEKYDIIHYHNIPDAGIFCAWLPKLMGCKIILDIHDVVPEFYMRKFHKTESHWMIKALKWAEKMSASFAHCVITVTEIWKNRLIERSVQPDKCEVIMNVPDETLFKWELCEEHRAQNPFVFGYHGNLSETTGVGTAIQAFAMAKPEMADAKMRIIGQGRCKEEYEILTESLKMSHDIYFMDVRPLYEIPSLLCDVNVGLDPKEGGMYSGETLSVKTMEYMGMHIPAIVSKTKAAQLYFDETMVAFFEPGNAEQLSEQMKRLYHSEKTRNLYRQNGIRFIAEYNWPHFEKKYMAILEKLIKTH